MTSKNTYQILVSFIMLINVAFSQSIMLTSSSSVDANIQQLKDNLSPKDYLAVLNYYGCKIWDINGICTQCSQGYYFNPKKICCIITPNCDNFNKISGQCQKCKDGYQFVNSSCSLIPNYNSTILHFDLGCSKWDWKAGICLQCSFRWILSQNKTCVPVSDFCKNYNKTGACTQCYTGYLLRLGACIYMLYNQTEISILNCVQWDSQKSICSSCAQGMKLNQNGVCVYAIQNCEIYNVNGSCNSCKAGYDLVKSSCLLFARASYKKIIPNKNSQALCLDGTPAALYFQQGTIKDKFLLYFIGGGDIGKQTVQATLQAAYQTSKTILGSSIYWPQDISNLVGGYLKDDQVYKGWNKVIFTYCDGSFHQGYVNQPVTYKNSTLHFKGSVITRSHFEWLVDNYNLNKASKIMLSGGSAGAVSVFLWSNYLKSIVQNPNSIYFVPDSGIFLNVNVPLINIPLISITLSNIFSLVNVDEKTPLSQCNAAYSGQQWKCFLVQYAYPFLSGRFLWINSQYDSYMIQNGLQISCLTNGISGDYTFSNCSTPQLLAIQSYRNTFMQFMNTKIKNQNNSALLIGCSSHVYAYYDEFYDSVNETIPYSSQNTVKDTIQQFVINDQYVWQQDGMWPNNKGCAY